MIQQTPWIERKFDFNFPAGMFPVILERLRGTIARLEKITSDLDDATASRKNSDQWSVKEQIGHLYDLEELWFGRIEDFLNGLTVLRAADMSNQKTQQADHQSKRLDELLNMFRKERMKLIQKVKDIDEDTATITAQHPRLQKNMRLVDSLFFVAEHDDHHLAKIRALIEGFAR